MIIKSRNIKPRKMSKYLMMSATVSMFDHQRLRTTAINPCDPVQFPMGLMRAPDVHSFFHLAGR